MYHGWRRIHIEELCAPMPISWHARLARFHDMGAPARFVAWASCPCSRVRTAVEWYSTRIRKSAALLYPRSREARRASIDFDDAFTIDPDGVPPTWAGR